jgi:hypothetical protein
LEKKGYNPRWKYTSGPSWRSLQSSVSSRENEVHPGQCVTFYLNNAVVTGPYESFLESLLSLYGRVISEWAITTNVSENLAGNALSPSRTVSWTTTASYKGEDREERMNQSRKLNFNDIVIYKNIWNGNRITLKLALSELDVEEKKEQQEILEGYLDKIDPASEKAKKFLGNTIVASPTGQIITVGVEAVKITAKLYNKIHQQDDIVIDHAQGFVAAEQKKDQDSTILKSGFWLLVRNAADTTSLANNSILRENPNIAFDPLNGIMLGSNRTWFSIRVAAEDKAACGG